MTRRGDGVILPTGRVGMSVKIINRSDAPMNVHINRSEVLELKQRRMIEFKKGGRGAMTPTALRALAARVLAEEPSEELRDAVLDALKIPSREPAIEEDGTPSGFVFIECDPLISHDAAFAAMPDAWEITICQEKSRWCVILRCPEAEGDDGNIVIEEYAPTLPRALTAAGLLARAVDAEQGDGA